MVKARAAVLDEQPHMLYWAAAGALATGAVVWILGRLWLDAGGHDTGYWDTMWGLGGISFLGAVILPIPGTTTAYLVAIHDTPHLAVIGVVGAAVGGTIGAALLLALGHTGRAALRRRAEHSARARKTLEWSKRMAKRWTYAGIAVLLVPPFLPRMPVLYAAVLAHLKTVPFLAAVFAGTLVRNLVVLAAIYGVFALPFL